MVLLTLTLTSCADSKTFTDNKGIEFTAEPYGWADYNEVKIDIVIYKPCIGNIVWDVLLSETVAIPIWLTGWQFYEPVGLKTPAQYNNQHK
jgi:hypothetical protein